MRKVQPDRVIFIYLLRQPGDLAIRYIGKSAKPKKRLWEHITEARSGEKCHRSNWLRKLLAAGERPILEIIEQATVETWTEREQYWIAFYRAEGCRLVNATDGGEGTLGLVPSEEHRARISEANRGRSHSPETRAKMGAAHKGKIVSAETRAKISEETKSRVARPKAVPPTKIYQRSAEWRAKIGESNRRRKLSDESKRRISEANTGRALSEETKMRMGQRYEVSCNDGPWETIQNLSRFVADLNLNKCMMYRVLNGTAPHHKGWRIRRPET
jgi:group I intron endonuclease